MFCIDCIGSPALRNVAHRAMRLTDPNALGMPIRIISCIYRPCLGGMLYFLRWRLSPTAHFCIQTGYWVSGGVEFLLFGLSGVWGEFCILAARGISVCSLCTLACCFSYMRNSSNFPAFWHCLPSVDVIRDSAAESSYDFA